MTHALALASRAADLGEVPVGAVVVRDDEWVSEGHNMPIAQRDPSAHAEIVALRAAARVADNYRLPGTTLYVTLEPCAMCAGAIVHARVDRVVYAADDPRAGGVRSVFAIFDEPSLNHRVQWEGGLFAAQSAALLQTFFRARRRGTKEGA